MESNADAAGYFEQLRHASMSALSCTLTSVLSLYNSLVVRTQASDFATGQVGGWGLRFSTLQWLLAFEYSNENVIAAPDRFFG